MSQILYGKPVAESIYKVVDSRISEFASAGLTCKIASIRIGDNPDDAAYERSISRACEKHGFEFDPIVFPSSVESHDVLAQVERLNNDDSVQGCIVFQPMPKHLNSRVICNSIQSNKDIDCASDRSLGDMMLGAKNAFAPATAEAVMKVCEYYGIDLAGKNVVVVGRSRVIGKPVGILALDRDATVTFCHSNTTELASIMRSAQIVVCAVGRSKFFTREFFDASQFVIDVGMNVDEEGALCGDVDYRSVEPLVSGITPVPGGVGAITTSILLEHASRHLLASDTESE